MSEAPKSLKRQRNSDQSLSPQEKNHPLLTVNQTGDLFKISFL